MPQPPQQSASFPAYANHPQLRDSEPRDEDAEAAHKRFVLKGLCTGLRLALHKALGTGANAAGGGGEGGAGLAAGPPGAPGQRGSTMSSGTTTSAGRASVVSAVTEDDSSEGSDFESLASRAKSSARVRRASLNEGIGGGGGGGAAGGGSWLTTTSASAASGGGSARRGSGAEAGNGNGSGSAGVGGGRESDDEMDRVLDAVHSTATKEVDSKVAEILAQVPLLPSDFPFLPYIPHPRRTHM